MNPFFLQQELLIIADSSFAWNECSIMSSPATMSNRDRLKLACWNGQVPLLLPECFTEKSGSLHLWEIQEGKSFIKLEYGGFAEGLEKEFSINPYTFMQVHIAN